MDSQPVSSQSRALLPSDVLRPELLAWQAYHVADSRGMVKLDAMENPYRLPEAIREEMGRVLAEAPIHRYPDPAATELVAALRAALDPPAGSELLLGNGSDELIQILCQSVARPGAVVMGLEPSFVMYRVAAEAAGCRFVGVSLTPDFRIDLDALEEAIRTHQPSLLFLAYPNNPTGNLFPREVIERVIAAATGLVVVDEAYHAFARTSFLGDLPAHPNLLVMRTLSKLGLAGLRLGILVGRPQWIRELDKLRLPYNVNVLTQRAACFALDRIEWLNAQAAQILADRKHLVTALTGIPGVLVYPTDANFVLFRVRGAVKVFEGLKRRNVLIRKLAGGHPLLDECLRVTVGTPDENALFLDALTDVMREADRALATNPGG